MDNKPLVIRDIRARGVNVPLSRPLNTASGSIGSAPLLLIDVLTDEDVTGSAYAFCYTQATVKPMICLLNEIKSELIGQKVIPHARMQQMQQRFRLLGIQGLLGMLLSTLDMAYWDACGKAAGLPVVRLLGGEPIPVPAYDSYGMIDLKRDTASLERSIEQGFKAIKIKLGASDARQDVEVTRAVRNIIGADTALMVDFNQSLTPEQALRRIAQIQEFDLHWIEEPVAAEDLQGHALLRRQLNVPIQTGENWWFPRDAQRAISAEACDMMMPDLMKIGGISGWLSVMGLAQAASMPVSSHLFIEASAHVLAITPTCHWLEFMDFARPVLQQPAQLINGCVSAQGPGLGMAWDSQACEKFAVT